MSLYLKRVGREETFVISPDKEKILIGRSIQCDISFPSLHISRQHCQIIRSPPNGALVIKNIRDTNCTYVNEVKLQDPDVCAELRIGSRIGLGVPLELATEDGIRNSNYVFLKLEGLQSSLQTRQSGTRRTEVGRNSEMGVHLQSGEPPPVITLSDRSPETACVQGDGGNCLISNHTNQEQRVPTIGLRPHEESSIEDLNSELVPAGSICSTSHDGPPVALQNGRSGSSCAATTSDALGLKGRLQQYTAVSEAGSAEEFNHMRQPESTTETSHKVKPNIITSKNSVDPMQANNSCHKPIQACNREYESDPSLAKKVDDQKGEISVSKKMVCQPTSVSNISSAQSQSATSGTIKDNEEPSSFISIDLTRTDPDSPSCSYFTGDTSKKEQLKKIIATNLTSLASPEVKIISSPETSQAKRKRFNDEPPSGSSEVSIKKKFKRTNLDANKSEVSKDEDIDSGNLIFPIDKKQNSHESGQNKALKDSDDESLFLMEKPKENINKSSQNELSESCDSGSESLVCVEAAKQKLNKCKSQKASSDSDSDSDSLFFKRESGSKCAQSKASADSSSSDSEPLPHKRKCSLNPNLIYSSDDSDIQVCPLEKETHTQKSVEKRDLPSCLNVHPQKCTVILTKLPSYISKDSTVEVDRHSFIEDSSASSSKRENENTENKSCFDNSDRSKSSQKNHYKRKRKRKAGSEYYSSHRYEEGVMQKHTTTEQMKYDRMQDESVGEHSSHPVIENTTRENNREGSGVPRRSESISASSVSLTSADSKQSNKVIETNEDSKEPTSKNDEKLKEPSKNAVEVSTEIKIKVEPGVSCKGEENDLSVENDADKDEVVFMYSQAGDEIWISSDEEEETPPSANASTCLDEALDFFFVDEDEQKIANAERCSSPENMPAEVDGEMDNHGCSDDEDQWFPILSQSFLDSPDEEADKDEECNRDSKDAPPNTIDSEPSPGPSGLSEPLPDSEEDESDNWWPILSQGFFDDDEPEVEEKEEDIVGTIDNNELEAEGSSDSTRAGDTSYLQSVIKKVKKKSPPRTSQLTEAKIPLHSSRKNNQKKSNQMETGNFNKTSGSSTTVKKNNDEKKQKQSASKIVEPVNKIGKKNKSQDLRKTLTSKFNLDSYKATIECRSKEKHHLVSKNKSKPNKPPLGPPHCKSSNEKTIHSKDSENISIQKKDKSVDPTSQDKVHFKVAAKNTRKSRFEKLIDCDIFSKPSKSTVTPKNKGFKIPKSSGSRTSGTPSVHSEAQGCRSVLDKRKQTKVAENKGEHALPDTAEPQPGSSSENRHIKKQTLSSAPTAVRNDTSERTDEICKDLQRVELKCKPKRVHFPQEEENLVQVFLIPPRKNGERSGPPSVRTKETLPEEMILHRKNVPQYYMELFVYQVCRWNYDWLDSYHAAQEYYRAGVSRKIPPPPPVVNSTNNPTLILYNSYNDYKETHSCLFYLELWEKIYKDWILNKNKNHDLQVSIEFVKPAHVKTSSNSLKFWAVKLIVPIPQQHNVSFHDFRQGTLIALKIRKEAKRSVIFGYIDYMMNNKQMAVASQNQGPAQMSHSSFSLGIRVAKETIQTVKPGTMVTMNWISYLRPSSRIWENLCKLPLSPLCNDILSPSPASFSCERETKYLVKNFPLNEVQEKAVTTVSSKCMYDSYIPKLSLIHGPPGTGKTSTIVALVAQLVIMGRSSGQGSKPHTRLLICAPSNAAVDELTLRLVQLRDTGLNLRVVRVGFKTSNHPLVRNVTLDQLVSKQMRMEISAPRCESAKQEWQRRRILVQEVAEELERARKEGRHNEIRQLEVRLNEMARAKADFEKSFTSQPSTREKYELEQKWQREFLLNAEVLTTTLNSCVSGVMGEVLGKYQYHFTCCIVDEAGQCQETEALLPLLLGIRKMVLVGDHHQLPATVLSQVALSKNLKQSLFERIHHRLVLELQREDLVHTLKMQYRMHPEIVAWPAQHFYMNKLTTSPALAVQANVILQPYIIFDLKNSQEERLNNQEMYNPAEASLVYMLLGVLQPHLSKKTVGIITPYQRQRIYLEEKLAKFKAIINLSINTIDGFQVCVT
ncbi:uncharacterized protein LOC126999018 isoform X2 [Eriocheir sinensis]|uniref:uncharacterized protein LOC126999018 isoform X2 n=1 Tax=Eriocheir sinensis TaxID=95602 RepID=UPI0021C938D8|nr:uncharacterized protein LOC126999018 isoform X2 [Eriocheir sinensis]